MHTLFHRAIYAAIAALAGVSLMLQPVAAAPLPRVHIVLPNTISVDPAAGVVTLPLHRGVANGQTVWYIVTDSSDAADAKRRGAIFAPLLASVGNGCAACLRAASERNGSITFPGAPKFAAVRSYVVSPTGFPPTSAQPGATADARYTPFIKIGKAVLNAPIVATGTGPFDVTRHADTQDRVIAIDTLKRTVTLALAQGFANGKRIVYISTEATDGGAATVERATFVPALAAHSGFVPIDVVANGRHQGLSFVALHGNVSQDAAAGNALRLGSAMNVLSTFPTGPAAAAYTPLWSVQIVAWKAGALAARRDVVLKSLTDVAGVAADTSGPGGKPVAPVGFFVNCPVIGYLDSAP